MRRRRVEAAPRPAYGHSATSNWGCPAEAPRRPAYRDCGTAECGRLTATAAGGHRRGADVVCVLLGVNVRYFRIAGRKGHHDDDVMRSTFDAASQVRRHTASQANTAEPGDRELAPDAAAMTFSSHKQNATTWSRYVAVQHSGQAAPGDLSGARADAPALLVSGRWASGRAASEPCPHPAPPPHTRAPQAACVTWRLWPARCRSAA